MADVQSRQYPAEFKGLLTDLYVALGVIGLGITIFEFNRKWKRKQGSTAEAYEMNGYLYTARHFVPFRPSPQHPRWPLAWVWQVIKLKEDFYAQHTSIDALAYVRILKGCLWYTSACACTVLPVLLTLHLHFSPDSFLSTDIQRASLSALVSDQANVHLLWVHVMFIWLMSFGWFLNLLWIGRGILRWRRRIIPSLAKQMIPPAKQEHLGWRHRTLLVQQVPGSMRSEKALREYFEDMLATKNAEDDSATPLLDATVKEVKSESPSIPAPNSQNPVLITHISIIRRTMQLHEIYRKREEALQALELAHIQLAQNVIKALTQHSKTETKNVEDLEKATFSTSTIDRLSPFLPGVRGKPNETIWEVLRQIPAVELDQHQPLTKLNKLFKGQFVPSIDYHLQKFNLYTTLTEDLRASPAENFVASPSAFVTFNNAADARRALRVIPKHPSKNWSCILSPSPDVRDIVWDKLVSASFGGDLVRSVLVEGFIWLFIVFWVPPVSFLLGFVSISNIAKVWPALSAYLAGHQSTNALLSSLVPTVLLSILLFLIPTMLIQLSNRGQHFYCLSRLHNAVLTRYWRFLMTDVVILFAAGSSAVQSVFTDPGKLLAASSLLNRIAAAFPAAATFFVGYSILVCALHPFFELPLIGFPWINHVSVHTAKTPRRRHDLALPRSINVYYWLPCHLLVVAILFVFAILNPLVIAFIVIYFCFSLVVFKRSFAFYYWIRHYQLNGKLIFIRFMRYSLDALMVGQVVLIALFFVSRAPQYGGATIPILILTALCKLAATRIFTAYSAILDVREADVICNNTSEKDELVSVPMMPSFLQKIKPFDRLRFNLKVKHQPDDALKPDSTSLENDLSASSTIEVSTELYRMAAHADSKSPLTLPPLVLPHPRTIRDDRTDNHALYDNPYLVSPLESGLWLPRDPLSAIIDLDDTIVYKGLAMVSTEGGHGRIGHWHTDFDADRTNPDAENSSALPDTALIEGGPPNIDALNMAEGSAITDDGLERIAVADGLPIEISSKSKMKETEDETQEAILPGHVRDSPEQEKRLQSSTSRLSLPTTPPPFGRVGSRQRRSVSNMSKLSMKSSRSSFMSVDGNTIPQEMAIRQEIFKEIETAPKSQQLKDEEAAHQADSSKVAGDEDKTSSSIIQRLLQKSGTATADYYHA